VKSIFGQVLSLLPEYNHNPMKTIFKYSRKAELENLLWEIDQKKKVKSYGLVSILPPSSVVKNYLTKQDAEIIKGYLDKEYDEQRYQTTLEYSEKIWQAKEKLFFQRLDEVISEKSLDKYYVWLTMFGPGGSYEMPNKVSIRLKTKDDLEYADVNIAHELIHLMVQRIVDREKMNHQQKEQLVEAILFQPVIAKVFGIRNKKVGLNPYFLHLDQLFPKINIDK